MSHKVQLCQTQLNRMPAEAAQLVDTLTGAGFEVDKQMCLNLCFGCSTRVIARLDGAPIGAGSCAELGEQLKAAAA
jgi:hypothetical protein